MHVTQMSTLCEIRCGFDGIILVVVRKQWGPSQVQLFDEKRGWQIDIDAWTVARTRAIPMGVERENDVNF